LEPQLISPLKVVSPDKLEPSFTQVHFLLAFLSFIGYDSAPETISIVLSFNHNTISTPENMPEAFLWYMLPDKKYIRNLKQIKNIRNA
jgi:hypothetical protein